MARWLLLFRVLGICALLLLALPALGCKEVTTESKNENLSLSQLREKANKLETELNATRADIKRKEIERTVYICRWIAVLAFAAVGVLILLCFLPFTLRLTPR